MRPQKQTIPTDLLTAQFMYIARGALQQEIFSQPSCSDITSHLENIPCRHSLLLAHAVRHRHFFGPSSCTTRLSTTTGFYIAKKHTENAPTSTRDEWYCLPQQESFANNVQVHVIFHLRSISRAET
jgi:hypothetical protein